MNLVHPSIKILVLLIVIAVAALLGCDGDGIDGTPLPHCTDPPIVNILDFLPPIHNSSITGVAPPDITDGAATIPTGGTVIVVKFDGKPCDLRVTNLPTATYFVREWYWDDLHPNWLLIEVYAPKTGGLIHFAVEWHSGGIVAKYLTRHI